MSGDFSAWCEKPGALELLAGEEPCPACASDDPGEMDSNYTYNVSPMFYKAFAGTSLQDTGIRGLNGTSAKTAVPLLEHAIRFFNEHEQELKALNPTNGWGNYDGALRLLESLHAFGKRHPRAIFGVH